MRRKRDLSSFSRQGQFAYESIGQLTGQQASPGLHTINLGPRFLDFVYDDTWGGGDTLLVVFPSAVSAKHGVYPTIQGRGIAKDAGMSLLSFSDPAIVDLSLETSWMFGGATFPLSSLIEPIIDHFANGRSIVFFGTSAGGFPALYYGNCFPGSLSFVVNPRTSLLVPPTRFYHVADVLYSGLALDCIGELMPLEAESPENFVLYFQNRNDFRYYSGQALPYLAKYLPEGRVGFRLGDWGAGHSPMPRDEIVRILGLVGDVDDWPSIKSRVGIGTDQSLRSVMFEHASAYIDAASVRDAVLDSA